MFFKNFPLTYFNFETGRYIVPNILRRVSIKLGIKDVITVFEDYTIKDSDRAVVIADRLYGDVNYEWIIYLLNDMYDPVNDWPLSEYALSEFIEDKYGIQNQYSTHHYITNTGIIVESDYLGEKFKVTNYEYEENLNNQKRNIKLLKPEYLSSFVSDFNKVVSGDE